MDAVKIFLEVVGLITTAISVLIFLTAVFAWFFGISPLLYRLGLGRWRRKIMILANADNYNSLKRDLVESGIFRSKNIDQISDQNLSNVKDSNLLLLHYKSFTDDQIKTILRNKKASAGMVVYFPDYSSKNKIPEDINNLINNEPHCVVVNFRGRLVNDVLVTLLSTSYDKK